MSLTDRIAGWFALPEPMEPYEIEWVPPALSAAAAPPQPVSPRVARDTPKQQDWQSRAWAFYRSSGPAREAVDWLANGISRMHLYIGQVRTQGVGDPERVEEPGLAGEILSELHDGQIGQSEMLRKLAVHLQVPGESWLIGYPRPPKSGEKPDTADRDRGTAWSVCSRKEWSLDTGDDTIRIKLPRHPDTDTDGWAEFPAASTVIVPVYQADPEDCTRPTSRFEAAMEDLNELDGLNRRTAADIKSRLAGAGLLLVPESTTVPNPGMSETGGNPLHGSPLIQNIITAASQAIQNPDSPSALVPIVAQIADEAIAKMQKVDFFSNFDAQVPVLREAARKNVAVALDVPSTVVTGIEDLNHWSAWTVQDEAIRTHLGPLAGLICTTLTREILWPALRASGKADAEDLVIWWDASEIELRPDRSADALAAHRDGIIGGKATRREIGFDEDDAPTPEELEEWRARSAARYYGSRSGARPLGEGGQATPAQQPNPPDQKQSEQRAQRTPAAV